MSAKRVQPAGTPPDLPPEKAQVALSEQLNALKKFQGADYRDAKAGFEQWFVLTEKLVLRSFGSQSTNLSHFRSCRFAGTPPTMSLDFARSYGEPHHEYQQNFETRLECFAGVLSSCIAELRMDIPEEEIRGAYEPGQEYEFYRDLKACLGQAQKEIFVVDPYLNPEIFDIYASAIPRTVFFRLLSANVPADVKTLAQKYAAGGNLAFRSSSTIHDRVLFADDRVWLIGQSLKDAAKKKPTYIIEHDTSLQRPIYERIWQAATPVL